MRRNYSPSEDVNLVKRQLHEVSIEKEKLREENNSLKTRVAGVETLSKLLQKSQEENANLRAELLRPKHQIVQRPTRTKTCSSVEYGHRSPSVATVAKENTGLRREFGPTIPEKQNDKQHTQHGLHDMKHTSTGRHNSTMAQLMEFKNEVIDELRRLQQSEQTVQKGDLLAMTTQLMDEIKLLEESIQSEEYIDLKPQWKLENEKQESRLRDLSENTTTSETSESVELLSQSGEETGTEWSGEFISENIGLAQGDQTGTEKSGCEYISEDGPLQELKLTRQLLTEANEKIIKLTNDNKMLTDMNVKWQEYNDQRDAFVKHLENQLSQSVEQTKTLQRSGESKHATSTERDSGAHNEAELRHKLETESQARLRAETTVRHLTNRLSSIMRQLELEKVKVSGLEEVVQQMTNWRNEETDDKERIKVLEEQIIICKEDFEGERADRERLHREKENAQVRLLQMEEKANILEHQNLAYQRELEQVHSQMAIYHLEARPSVRLLDHQRGRLGYGSTPCLLSQGRGLPVVGVLPRGKTTLPHDVEIDGDVIDGPAGSAWNREMSAKEQTVREVSVDNAGLRDSFQRLTSPDFRKEREPASI